MIVEGQIETLKNLKEALRRSGVTRFKSVGDIRSFLRDFETEKEQLPSRIERELETELRDMQSTLASHQQAYAEWRARVRHELEQQILALHAGIAQASERSSKNLIYKVIAFFKISSLSRRASRLERNLERTIKSRTDSARTTIARLEVDFENLLKNKEKLFSQRCERSLRELNHTKE
ncbi:MAG: hypothetical protein OEW90_02480, partial [Betaproteobacteria bacterium]|nr:hypothetical protein [Betaproteobacteria bacterium]